MSSDHASKENDSPLRFCRAGATYEKHGRPQAWAAAEVVRAFPVQEKVSRILDVGAGTGILTERLAAIYPDAAIDALDISPGMIEQGHRRLPHVNWVHADILHFRAEGNYDLIASSSALHWVPDLRSVFHRLLPLVAPGGWLTAGLMVQGTLRELRTLRQRVAPDNPPIRQLPTAADARNALQVSGFTIINSYAVERRFDYAGASDLLCALHEQGVTGGDFSRGQRPLRRGELRRLVELYDDEHKRQGRVYATYRVLILSATHPVNAKKRQSPETPASGRLSPR